MNVRLRIINNQKIPELPSLTKNSSDNLTTDVKLDVLTHQEVDRNFANIITWLKTSADKLLEHQDLLGNLSPESLEKLAQASLQIIELTENLQIQKEKLDSLENAFNKFKESTNTALERKIENIKTINGVDIKGIGNAEINISRYQFTNHFNDISLTESGSIGIFECKINLIENQLYAGSNLSNSIFAYMQGTWKCLGIISGKRGLFKRIS